MPTVSFIVSLTKEIFILNKTFAQKMYREDEDMQCFRGKVFLEESNMNGFPLFFNHGPCIKQPLLPPYSWSHSLYINYILQKGLQTPLEKWTSSLSAESIHIIVFDETSDLIIGFSFSQCQIIVLGCISQWGNTCRSEERRVG